MKPEQDLATPDDVMNFVSHVPDELLGCRADHHPFQPQDVIAYTVNGNETKNYQRAAALDITEVCATCGLLRHHTRSLRTRDRSTYTYSNPNPLLRAPKGVWETGVSVRAELQHSMWAKWCANGGKLPATAAARSKRRSSRAA